MPVRDKAEVAVMPMFAGKLRWSMGQVTGAPGLDEDEWWEVCDFISEMFVQTMESIDFNRVILEAGGMCTQKQDADPDHRPKIKAVYKHDSLIEEHNPDFNMEEAFCADCFRLCILRVQKHQVMTQEDVADTLPEERPPEGWHLPRSLAEEFVAWLKKRKESWQ